MRVGQYQVTGLLGVGGMGDVYTAISEHSSKVALKTLSNIAPERVLLFKNEFRYVADLAHPNLVPLYELNCDGDLWFFTMELVDGVTLMDWLLGTPGDKAEVTTALQAAATLAATPRARSGVRDDEAAGARPTTEVVCDLGRFVPAMAQLLDALEYLHQHGIVHQDLKPSNVLVRADGLVRLLDFGVASRIGQHMALRGVSTVVGTPAYMSPEQWRGLPATPSSDLFSLGCMMFQLLTGELPFGATFDQAQRAPRVEDRVTGVPAALAEVCHRLMARTPGERPSIDDVRAALGLERPRATAGGAAATRFVGRRHEREVLAQALRRVREGGSVVVQVRGLSGVGKSALLRSCSGELRGQSDVLVLRGRCYERESVPYKAFDGMLEELAGRLALCGEDEAARLLPVWSAELAQVFPVLAQVPAVAARLAGAEPVSAVELRRRALAALRQLLGNLAAQQPLLLEVDDLQWVDGDSAALLLKMLEAPTPRVLLALSFRPREAALNPALTPYLQRLGGLPAARVVSIDVGPLDADESTELARQTLASLGLPETLAPVIVAESAGIPFFVEELAHSVAQQRQAGVAVEAATVTLATVLAERVRALPDAERTLVEVLSVANSPIAMAVAVQAADLDDGALRCVVALRRGHFIHSFGVRAEDQLEIYHDRTRESVMAYLSEARIREHHLRLGRALSQRNAGEVLGPWVFDAVRHLGAAAELLTDPAERLAAARLHLAAGRMARQSAAFSLAFRCFEAGIALLAPDAWAREYDLALGLHAGAAEAAYLSAEWGPLERRIAEVKAHARTLADQLLVWEVQIDACAGRHEYLASIAAGLEVLGLLGVQLPAEPGPPEIGAAFQHALAELTRVGPEGLAAMPDADDPLVLAAMRIQIRLSPAVYFARPALLPIIACNLITTSIERGLSTATPNALALFGIILNTQDLFPISHVWGQLAIRLLERWEDRSLEAATRHVVYNLVCPWLQPLPDVLASSREVFEIGRRTGDFEYGSYAAHTWVYLAMYCGRPLGPLLEEALTLGEQMRALGQINAVHVHAPFEQLLRCLTGAQPNPASLDDAHFREADTLATAAAAGSRSGIFITRKVMGMARYHFGRYTEASACLEIARPFIDAAPSCWLIPIFHQFAALAGCAAWPDLDPAARAALRPHLEASLGELRKLARHAAMNFAHRVSLVEAELCRIDGDPAGALALLDRAISQAQEVSWLPDLALAHELAVRCLGALGRADEAALRLRAARDLYARWGAHAKVVALDGGVRLSGQGGGG
ncbi:MAG: protein kinase [Deltaproteobacteria bacterium]|nr:protein kinase [Deltaproteobacteria bacterium]